VVCEAVDAREVSVNGVGKGEGIQVGAMVLQSGDLGRVALARRQQPVQRRLRALVDAREAGADADFAQELHGGLKEIHQCAGESLGSEEEVVYL